jgi:transposase-like protein
MSEINEISKHEVFKVCKHCGCEHLIKNGLDNKTDDQRYKCKNCKKTFILKE